MRNPEDTPYPDAQRLANRLRMLAEEVESAARYGLPIPSRVSVGGYRFSDASFAATEHEFAAWVDYTGARVEEYEHDGARWSSAEADLSGLPLRFAVRHGAPVPVLAEATS